MFYKEPKLLYLEKEYKRATWQKDPQTGLIWSPVSKEKMTWYEAQNWVEAQGGRLPTRLELFTLFETGPKRITNIMKKESFWSSIPYYYNDDLVWTVTIIRNYPMHPEDKNRLNLVRCIKDMS